MRMYLNIPEGEMVTIGISWRGFEWAYIVIQFKITKLDKRQQNNMNYKTSWIFLGLIVCISSYTDVTMLNCPAQFSVSTYNMTNDSTVATMGSFVYAAFNSESSKKKVEQIVVKGDYQALNSYMITLMIPYLIFAVIFFAFFIFTVMCCLFNRSCPPCDSIRRDIDNNPYSNKQIRLMMVLLLLCASGTLVISVISYSYVPDMKTYLEMTDCSIYLALDTAMNGDGTWGGFTNIRDKVGNITNLLSAAVTQIQIYFPGDSWLVSSMQAMQTANVNIYDKYKSSQMVTPNPDTTATNLNANLSVPMIDSRFIRQGLGPNGTENTMITDIDYGLRTTEKLSNQAYAITQSAGFIQSSLNTILNNSLASQNTLLMYNHQLNTSLTEYQAFSQLYFYQNFGLAMTVFEAVFGVALTGSLVILLGMVATHAFEILSCRKMVHLGWAIYGISYVGVIAVAFFVVSVGSISYNFCRYFNEMLTEQVSYNKLGQSYTQNLFTRMDTCLFGNGNSLQKFALAHEMGTVSQLFSNIEIYFDYANAAGQNYVNPNISTTTIKGWIDAIKNYKLGVFIDCSSQVTSDDNPNYAISNLNLYTYQGGGVTTGSKDVWVWDKLNCTDPTQIIYNASVAQNITLSTTNVTCISFNEKPKINASIWSFSDFVNRYIQIRKAYSDAYDKIKYYGQTLIAFRDSRISLFQAIQDDLTSLYQNNKNFNTQLINLNGRVKQFYDAVSTLNNLVTNSLSGLSASSNCHSLADKLRFTYNVYCLNFMASVTKIALSSILMLILMFLGIIAGSRFGIMYAEVEKIKRVTIPEDTHTQKDIAQQMDGAHSSQSEDSDD